ncbi:MAG: hypothetical protein PUB55_07640 [Bacteroidales bacterium]|nr:hypothetical protein [Bacteroidales bacterium]
MDKDEIMSLKGLNVRIKKTNNTEVSSQILNLIGASNEPYLPCGFILSSNEEILFGSVKELTIII